MAILDIFKKNEEAKRYEKNRHAKDVVKSAPKKKVASKKVEKPKTKEKENEPENKSVAKASDVASKTLVSPHVTEKSTILSEKGVYVFKIASRANKIMVKKAVKDLYGVIPTKVRIVNSPAKSISYRGRPGEKSGHKKAMVYLKQGDKLEI